MWHGWRSQPLELEGDENETNLMCLYGQVDDQPPGARGTGVVCHSNGSPDGQWLVGDTFARNLRLIDRRNDAETLLTTGRSHPDTLKR